MTTSDGPAPALGTPNAPSVPLPQPTRKVFKCIVDDTAFLAGAKTSTRDGIKKWVNNGSIRLFVPLHTMEALQHLAGGSTRIATDAKDALIWLDDISDDPSISEAGLVQLQGGEDEYERWADVEKFLLPETLLSMKPESEASDDVAEDMDGLHIDEEDMESASESSHDSNELRTHTPSSPRSAYSASSPAVLHSSPYKGAKTPPTPVNGRTGDMKTYSNGSFKTGESASLVPLNYKRLFNYIVWRINHGQQYSGTLSDDLDTFILLTNDDRKRQIAQRFGIRAKRLEQLRDIIAREDREYKNRQTVLKKEIE
ncbi:hypothetical protein LTS18_006821, partial [Coniosporium uncinatum]